MKPRLYRSYRTGGIFTAGDAGVNRRRPRAFENGGFTPRRAGSTLAGLAVLRR
jgi:hypothetical protein